MILCSVKLRNVSLSDSDFVLIAVRLKSSRLPSKALRDINGKSLLLRLVERIEKRFSRKQIIICTSVNSGDDEIHTFAIENDIACYRGDELDVMKRFIFVV